MRQALKILRYQMRDTLRSRWILAYGAFFLIVTDALFRFGGSGDRVVLSMMNVVLIVIPLAALVLGTMYLYSSRDYVELLVAQPIRRSTLFAGLYGGLVLPLAAAFLAGTGVPFLLHGGLGAAAPALATLLVAGLLLTAVFVALAFAVALTTEDRVRGLGLALAVWLGLAVLYNGFVLLVINVFADYPLQRAVIALTMLNPIDLGRILLLLQLDISAMMGFTGAVFERFFGSSLGRALSVAGLMAWVTVPLLAGRRLFLRKDF